VLAPPFSNVTDVTERTKGGASLDNGSHFVHHLYACGRKSLHIPTYWTASSIGWPEEAEAPPPSPPFPESSSEEDRGEVIGVPHIPHLKMGANENRSRLQRLD